ncbi:MAG: hypothetical protein SWQ30_23230 [Thermodesulfobacteriota bacterium]|nr:hypothetical protein [Thermodesulfobacteriota bacterium]
MRDSLDVMHPVYLPFSESQLAPHFADVSMGQTSTANRDKHLAYYRNSLERYRAYHKESPDRKGKPLSELRMPCQMEKDERFWTAACLMTVFQSENRAQELISLLKKAYGDVPPITDIADWEECVDGELHLFFEPNLPSPQEYKQWLRTNLARQQFIPYILNSDNGRKNLEGATNVDAMLLNSERGFAVIIEAKVLSDISYQVTYDAMRNQIARNIDVMLEPNEDLCDPLKARDPNKTLFLLLTPRIFKDNPATRLYGYKMNDYRKDWRCLQKDLQHRENVDWQRLSKRLGWLTWEDFSDVNSDCCRWLS